VPVTPAETAVPAAVVDLLVAVRPSLAGVALTGAESLTGDLGFDSLDLVSLANEVRARNPAVDLRAWIADTMESEVDSVASLAAALATAEESNNG